MTAARTVSETNISDYPLIHRGKVRDVYGVGDDRLLLIATDRISAFDCVMPNPIPLKGKVLTELSVFWFKRLADVSAHHLISSNLDEMPPGIKERPELRGRSMLVKKTEVFPVECVVRGYLEGSGWKDYQQTGEICGQPLPAGLVQCDKLPEPLFTPATKAPTGHDQNISHAEAEEIVGARAFQELKSLTLKIYRHASEFAEKRGIIIADTKFEFGLDQDGEIILIDEVLTPDSSRFWSVDSFQPGRPQPSFDKQFVREYLETLDWDKQPPAPRLPEKIVRATTDRYREAYRILTGADLDDLDI